MAAMTPEARTKAEDMILDLYVHLDRYGKEGDAFTAVYAALDSYVSAHRLTQQYRAIRAIREEEEREERFNNGPFGVGA